jgi:hypothetical protein
METILMMHNDCWIMIVIDVCVDHAFTAQQVAFLPHMLALFLQRVLTKGIVAFLIKQLSCLADEGREQFQFADRCARFLDRGNSSKSRVITAQGPSNCIIYERGITPSRLGDDL